LNFIFGRFDTMVESGFVLIAGLHLNPDGLAQFREDAMKHCPPRGRVRQRLVHGERRLMQDAFAGT
jgi:hypothetical protein